MSSIRIRFRSKWVFSIGIGSKGIRFESIRVGFCNKSKAREYIGSSSCKQWVYRRFYGRLSLLLTRAAGDAHHVSSTHSTAWHRCADVLYIDPPVVTWIIKWLITINYLYVHCSIFYKNALKIIIFFFSEENHFNLQIFYLNFDQIFDSHIYTFWEKVQ